MKKAVIKTIISLFLFLIFINVRAQQMDSLPQKTKDLLIEAQRKKFSKKGNSSKVDPKDYYPLQVGNYWEYNHNVEFSNKTDYVYIIGDTIMANQKKYYMIEFVSVNGDGTLSYKIIYYKRINDIGTVFIFNKFYGCEVISEKLGSPVGEVFLSWKYGFISCDTSNRYGVVMDSGLSNGRFWKEIRYTDNPDHFLGNLFWSKEYYYEGIGLTYIHQAFNNDTYLKGAIIGKDTFGSITAVSKTDNIPDIVDFYQNYPNPFNPSTTIQFNIKESGFVTLKVYDILGKEINTLVNENKETGQYTVIFDASKLSSGTYFYKLSIKSANGGKEIIQQKSMQVLK